MNENGGLLPVQERIGLRSVTRRLVRLLSSKARTASDSSYTPSLTPLRRPLVSLLEVTPFSRKDVSFIPLLVNPLRSCYESQAKMLAVSRLDGASAAQLAEIVQACLDLSPHALGSTRSSLLGLLQVVCSTHLLLPRRFLLGQVSFDATHPIGNRPDTAIYGGAYQEQSVAVREIFLPGGANWSSFMGKTTLKAMFHELMEQFQLKHRNVLRILGIFLENDTIPLIVTFRMSCGAVIPWLRDHGTPEAMIKILQGAADGLAYLHSQDPPVIHGSIHPNNILISDEREAVLCDFGLDRVRHVDHDWGFTIRAGGKWRYMAPELFAETGALYPTEASDIYSLAMTFLAIVTLRPPFSEYRSDFTGSSALQKGVRPSRPEEMVSLTKSQADSLWVLLASMWDHEPSARPRGTSVYDYLKWRLRPHGGIMPSHPPTGMKLNPRARAMSSVMPPKLPTLPLNNGAIPTKSVGRFDRAHHRSRVFSVPLTPKLESLIE